MLHYLSHHYILRTEEPVGAGVAGAAQIQKDGRLLHHWEQEVNTKSRSSGEFQHNLWFGVWSTFPFRKRSRRGAGRAEGD